MNFSYLVTAHIRPTNFRMTMMTVTLRTMPARKFNPVQSDGQTSATPEATSTT